MKKLLIALALVSSAAFAHDEGHHKPMKDDGTAVNVYKVSEATKKGAEAKYKAKLAMREDKSVMIELYDTKLAALEPKNFAKTARAELEFKKKSKFVKTAFASPLTLEGDAFKGTAPTAGNKPYKMNVYLNDGTDDLVVTFPNLDY